MMSKKQSGCNKTLTSTKTGKPTQKSRGKDPGPPMAPVPDGSNQAGCSTAKPIFRYGKSNTGAGVSVSSRTVDRRAMGSKVGSSFNKGIISRNSCVGHLSARPASNPARTAIRLCSSRSSPSLHTSSLSAAPFMRSCHSLSRLDRSPIRDETGSGHTLPKSQVNSGPSSLENTVLESGPLSSPAATQEPCRDNKGQCDGDNAEKMETSSSSVPVAASSSSVVSSAGCHQHSNELKKQDPSEDSAPQRSVPDVSRSSLVRRHRSKSLDCRDVEASAIPDLLNFKKGWMMRQDAEGQWQKHWFVLTDQILRFYSDSVAEEAADMDGEINLSTCFDITDYPAQKNYGFQIHTKDGVYTLCAMTSGIRRNWVQAVLKNVRPTLTPDVTSSLPTTQLTAQRADSKSAEVVGSTAHQRSCVRDCSREGNYKTFDWTEVTHPQHREQEPKLQLEREQDSADGGSASSSHVSSPGSSAASSASQCVGDPPRQAEAGQENASCGQRPVLIGKIQTGVTDCSSGAAACQSEGVQNDGSTCTAVSSNHEGYDELSNVRDQTEPRWQQVETTPLREERRVSISSTCEYMKETEKLCCEQQMGQLVKELEQTQRELSRLQQLNRNLHDQLQQDREHHSREGVHPQNGLVSTSSSSSAQALALQRLQKMNHDLRFELEAQRRSQEEAREAELRRRVDLLAQQAQLLVTGDATALAHAILEQDRRQFCEQQVEWERCMGSLQSQLRISEEQRKEAESRLMQLQQECQGYQSLQQEANRLREHLQDLTTQLCANEEAQAQKEARLQKHLVLLQESQDRERRSLASSLAQAEQHAQDLQERLNRAEQQVDSLNKGQSWTRQIEKAQQELQEELARTVSAVQRLHEEKEQLNCHCQELQNQLAEADGEVSRLQNRLKAEETHYYNLEHSYERVYEELQTALGQAQGREVEAQDIREGYERLLDRKEQELSEVLVKMEILGNSLEETEVKLTEVLHGCTCASSQQVNGSSESSSHNETTQQTTETLLAVNDSGPEVKSSRRSSNSSDATDAVELNGDPSCAEYARTRSRSIDPSYQGIVTPGDDPDRFMSVIQFLETKLYVTEEKLRDITQRLEDHQSHTNCQDPHLCSQLTQSRAKAQHLSLLLHSQAKQSQRFALETENRSRVLAGRFQAALKIVEACRERLRGFHMNQGERGSAVDITAFEKQLATAAACLQQGEKDAEKQQHESHYACRGEDKIISDEPLHGDKISTGGKKTEMSSTEDERGSMGSTLMREIFVVEKMVSVLQSQHNIVQLHLGSGEDEGSVAHWYKSIISQKIALKMEKQTQPGKAESGSSLESAIGRVCAEAELIYTALKFQQQYERISQGDLQVNDREVERLWQSPVKCGDMSVVPIWGLADINPPELASYEEQVQVEARGLEEAAKPLDGEKSVTNEVEKEPGLLERLISRLQRRAKVLRQLCQEISDCNEPDNESSVDHNCVNDSAIDLTWVQEQAKLIYLSDRLYLDLELELQQSKVVHDRLHAMCKEKDATLINEQKAFNHTLCELQEDNSVLREQLECAEQKVISAETGNQRLLEDIQKIENYHEERMQKLEKEFQEKICELQQIHEEEMKHLHRYYAKSACISKDKQAKSCMEAPPLPKPPTSPPDLTLNSDPAEELIMDEPNNQVSPTGTMKGQINESETKTEKEPGNRMVEGDAAAVREAYQKDFAKLKASCDQGFTAMEEMHRRLVSDLQQQHQRKVAALLKEKDQLLKEETAATMTAIVAMRKAHKEELERSQLSQHIRTSTNITQLHTEYEKEIQLLHKELEVLSVQHTQKCLENSQMSQELQAERQALLQYQKENQELKNKQEITQRITDKIHSSLNGKQTSATPQANDLYEMEVILRVKDAEIKFLRWEALSLREELKIAQMGKLKGLYPNKQDEPQHHGTRLWEDFKYATWSHKDHNRGKATSGQEYGETLTSKSDAVFQKKAERTSFMRQIRAVRSKSLKEGLSLQERMKLFESF